MTTHRYDSVLYECMCRTMKLCLLKEPLPASTQNLCVKYLTALEDCVKSGIVERCDLYKDLWSRLELTNLCWDIEDEEDDLPIRLFDMTVDMTYGDRLHNNDIRLGDIRGGS